MAETRQQKVDRILSVIPPYGQSLASDKNGDKFSQVTNWTHEGLLKQWAKERAQYEADLVTEKKGGTKAIYHKTTTCNAFTGWYGGQLGCKKHVGRFDIDKVFPDAWVPSTAGSRPNYGDICRFTRFHVGVSLDFDGNMWNSVEGGQGGPSSGRDIVLRKKTAYSSSLLRGWLDITKLDGVDLAGGAQAKNGAAWPLGWWAVTWRGKDFFYLFERGGRVKFTRTRPLTNTEPLLKPIDTGTYSTGESVRITWKTTKAVEVLRRSDTDTAMKGLWNGKVAMTAKKL